MRVEASWSGHTYKDKTGVEYKVVVDVTVTNVGTEKKNADAPNRIHIESNIKGGRDFVITLGGIDRGSWSPSTHPVVRAHEFGHLIGLGDDYYRVTGLPKPGHDGHLMGGGRMPWGVDQHEVIDVVGRYMKKYNQSGKSSFRVH